MLLFKIKKYSQLEKENKELKENLDICQAQLHVSRAQVSGLQTDIEIHKLTIQELKKSPRYEVNWSIDDPMPGDVQSRSDYASQVLSFFENIFYKKVTQLIARANADLANPLNGRDYDLMAKGTINALSQLLDWKDALEAEQNQSKQDKLNDINS